MLCIVKKVAFFLTMYCTRHVQFFKTRSTMDAYVYVHMYTTSGVHVHVHVHHHSQHIMIPPPFPPLPSPLIPLTNHFHLHKLFHWEREGKEREGVKPNTCIATLAALQLRLQLKKGTEAKAGTQHEPHTNIDRATSRQLTPRQDDSI